MAVSQRPERWKIHEVDEGDLDFRRVPVMVTRFDGSTSKAWVPVGMPKIHQRFLDAAFFLYRDDGKEPKSFVGPYGTGCVVARASTNAGEPHHYYAVSNRHVTRNAPGVSAPSPVIRINTFDGKHRFIEKTPDDWIFVGGNYDLAIADITDDLNTETDAVSCVPENGFITEKFVENFDVGVGDDLFMLGLFADQHGAEANAPSGRFVNVSLMASADAPVADHFGTLKLPTKDGSASEGSGAARRHRGCWQRRRPEAPGARAAPSFRS